MSSNRFAVIMLLVIVSLLLGLAVERYQLCQEKGGDYCKIGPRPRVLPIPLPK